MMDLTLHREIFKPADIRCPPPKSDGSKTKVNREKRRDSAIHILQQFCGLCMWPGATHLDPDEMHYNHGNRGQVALWTATIKDPWHAHGSEETCDTSCAAGDLHRPMFAQVQ